MEIIFIHTHIQIYVDTETLRRRVTEARRHRDTRRYIHRHIHRYTYTYARRSRKAGRVIE